jgi:hypothetical protein
VNSVVELGFHKMWGISRISQELSAYKEGSCCIQLVSEHERCYICSSDKATHTAAKTCTVIYEGRQFPYRRIWVKNSTEKLNFVASFPFEIQQRLLYLNPDSLHKRRTALGLVKTNGMAR